VSGPAGRLRTFKGQALVLASLLLLLAALLALAGATTLSRATSDLRTIDSESIPSVAAAQSITRFIDIIDAQAADYLAAAALTNRAPCALAGFASARPVLSVHDCDERNIDAESALVNQQIFEAAHNVTYPGERTAVERIMIGLESYLGDIHQMRVDYGLATSKTDQNDPSLRRAYQAYLNASAILHNQVRLETLGSERIPFEKEATLPACALPDGRTLAPAQWTQGGLIDALGCLSSINYQHLRGAYDDSAAFLGGATGLLAFLCVLFCGLLLAATARLVLTTHRLLLPGLSGAVLLGLILSVAVVGLLSSLSGQGSQASQDGAFRQLVLDDYTSVYYTALLDHYGTAANADESRWLIAREFADQANIQHWQTDWDSNVRQIEALIRLAHTNQTWVEELRPLADSDTYWRQYRALDGQIRSLATQPNDPARLLRAETLSTGASNRAFSAFIDAVDRLGQANHDHYLQTLNATQGALLRDFWFSLLLFPLAGLLALWGIATRLQDL
jgi:type II secretory pathway pseudopilin PulG